MNKHINHYGTKGMRWGVRKGASKKTDVKKMTDAQLRKAIDRMRLEQSYSSLSSANSGPVKRGIEATQRIVVGAATATISSYVAKQMVSALNIATSKVSGG